LVAIVDALGTADYSMDRVSSYIKSLDELLTETTRFAQDQAVHFVERFDIGMLQRFVFQDSVLFVYVHRDSNEITLNEILWFCHVLRTFQGGAFDRNLLFRGAWAMGDLYLVNRKDSAVLGPAVRDAARWYERAEWIGIHATPRTSILTQSLLDREGTTADFVLLDYDVPMKSGQPVKLKAVNWPKNLHLRYWKSTGREIRGILQSKMAVDPIPEGAERKHFHALKFFDDVIAGQELQESWKKRNDDPQAANPAVR
jgi:hypothetical protein